MTTVSDLKENISRLDIGLTASVAVESTKEVMTDLQRDQLLRGVRSDGKRIGVYKNKKYALKKHDMNPLPGLGFMDWKLTGSLHRELFVDVREKDYVIDSADSKTGDLIERFGDPFGLTAKNTETWVEDHLREAMMGEIEKATGL